MSDRETLQLYSDGIICLAACLSGEISLHLRQGKYDEARRSAEWFASLFGPDRFSLSALVVEAPGYVTTRKPIPVKGPEPYSVQFYVQKAPQ